MTAPILTTIPAHAFEPAKRATDSGTVDDERCGYMHRIDDATGVWCGEAADHNVHHGSDRPVRVHDQEDEN